MAWSAPSPEKVSRFGSKVRTLPASFSFDVPGERAVVLVVHELTPGAGCPEYTLAVSGLRCPPPVLGISREPNTTEVLLRWTTGAPGFQLEATPALAPIDFQPVIDPPVVINGKYTVTNNPVGSSQFYRLRK